MGGSLGMAIKKHELAKEVVGLSQKQSSLMQAIQSGAIDIAETDVANAVKNADLIVLAAPVESIVQLLSRMSKFIRRGCIITDLGSAKTTIVEEAEKVLPIPGFFVGSHPLVGSEKTGVANARADLFDKAVCIMTPTETTNQVAKEKVKHLWAKLGAEVKVMTPQQHDEALAYISHLPHVLAYGVMNTMPKDFLALAPQSLKDMTRIASSAPQMWSDICLANSRNLTKSLDEMVHHLAEMRRGIIAGNKNDLMQKFTEAKEKRDTII